MDFQFLSTLQKKKNFCTSVHDNLSITISEASLTESYIYIYTCQVSKYLRDQHRLVLAILQHVMIGIVTNGEDMGWHLRSAFTSVCKDNLLCVDRKSSVWIDGNTEKARVCLPKIWRNKLIQLISGYHWFWIYVNV